MLSDLHATRQRLRTGQTQATSEIERAIQAAQSPACQHAFLQTTFDEARAIAHTPGIQTKPLARLAVSIQHLFDVAEHTPGAAFIGRGSDTGGSIRIPAALNGIVGFKSTARLVPTQGALPLSTTLDTVCAMTRSVRDAMLAHELLAQRQVTRSSAPLAAYRLAVARTLMQDELDDTVSRAWQRTLATLRRAG